MCMNIHMILDACLCPLDLPVCWHSAHVRVPQSPAWTLWAACERRSLCVCVGLNQTGLLPGEAWAPVRHPPQTVLGPALALRPVHGLLSLCYFGEPHAAFKGNAGLTASSGPALPPAPAAALHVCSDRLPAWASTSGLHLGRNQGAASRPTWHHLAQGPGAGAAGQASVGPAGPSPSPLPSWCCSSGFLEAST